MTISHTGPEENIDIYKKMARGVIWLGYDAIML
jgi:hypothetical protein